MPNEEEMTINEGRKYLRLIKKRYVKTSKLEGGRLLGEMEVVTGLHLKSLIRLVSSDQNGSLAVSTVVVNMALKSTMGCGSFLRVSTTYCGQWGEIPWPAWRQTACALAQVVPGRAGNDRPGAGEQANSHGYYPSGF